MMQVHTYDDIMALEPCCDPAARGYCTRDWQGTALDVLRHPAVSVQDKLWLVLRESWIPAHILHEFACQLAEQALERAGDPDPRSVAAIAVKRRWLRGEATDDELAAARDAAWDAWRAARHDARGDAWAAWDAWAAASDTARDAAWETARDATGDMQSKQLEAMLSELLGTAPFDPNRGPGIEQLLKDYFVREYSEGDYYNLLRYDLSGESVERVARVLRTEALGDWLAVKSQTLRNDLVEWLIDRVPWHEIAQDFLADWAKLDTEETQDE